MEYKLSAQLMGHDSDVSAFLCYAALYLGTELSLSKPPDLRIAYAQDAQPSRTKKY